MEDLELASNSVFLIRFHQLYMYVFCVNDFCKTVFLICQFSTDSPDAVVKTPSQARGDCRQVFFPVYLMLFNLIFN